MKKLVSLLLVAMMALSFIPAMADEPIEIRILCEKGNVIFGYDDAYIHYNDGRKNLQLYDGR